MNRNRQIYLLLLLFCATLLAGCGSDNLTLINKVKRFEPEWMNLSEQVTFIERNLKITEKRYPEDLRDVEPYITNPATSQRNSMYGLKSQYMNMMEERDDLATRFEEAKASFTQQVNDFNFWQNELMHDKLDEAQAVPQLDQFKKDHAELSDEISRIQNQLIRNIESHNSLMRRITEALRLYTNYDINYR
ncbi:hypothetical protein [Pontibacter sp. G13]|uniref:hypothetical protein n=1 Tax=Pontibacter sp. G13 TaxID=3074898 RepID=UPI002889E8E0|nr:hypothetical protein [Pontibacter sp. G13]WNJ16129.1 hypothetical protein RJD25_14800 [Pontibacter sp. G13]